MMNFIIFIPQADSNDNDDEDAPSIYDEDITTMIIQELGLIGEVTLVRFVGETMWVTFRDGQSALIAVQKKSICIRGINFHFNLKTENWLAQVEREIALCTTNTVQLCTSSPSKIFILNLHFYDNLNSIYKTICFDFVQLAITTAWESLKYHQCVPNHHQQDRNHQCDLRFQLHRNIHQKQESLVL